MEYFKKLKPATNILKTICFLVFLMIAEQVFSQNKLLVFSHNAGFYSKAITVYLKGDADGFLYTVDGSVPTESNGVIYRNIPISPSNGISINRTTVLRVKPIVKGVVQDKIYTNTYFINFSSRFAIFSLATNPGNLWDENYGIYVKGPDADTAFPFKNANFWKKWERVCHVEFFETTEERIIAQDAGLRIFGGLTRALPEKSLRIIARKGLGNKRFRYKFFAEKQRDEFKHLVFRTSGGDYKQTRFLDAMSTHLTNGLDIDFQAHRPVILFVNGSYWGVYNLREKLNKRFLKHNRGADPDETDLLTLNAGVEHGSKDRYVEMQQFIKTHDLANDKHYRRLNDEYMDIRNYMNYRITQIYLCNVDSRGNIRYWRAGNLDDNRFRWIIYDTDLGMGYSQPASANYLHDRLSAVQTDWYNPVWATFMLRNLMKNKQAQYDFINQAAYLLNTNFHEDTVVRRVEMYRKWYAHEMPRHFKRREGTLRSWNLNVDKLVRFAKARPGFMRKHLMKEFNLKDTFFLKVSVKPPGAGKLIINRNEIQGAGFSGMFFCDVPLPVTIIPDSAYQLVQWIGHKSKSNKIKLLANQKKVEITAILEYKNKSDWHDKIVINEINCSLDEKLPFCNWVEIVNLTTTDVKLGNWLFGNNNRYFRFPDSIQIPAESYLVLCYDTIYFKKNFLLHSAIIGNFPFRLKNTSEIVKILDANGLLVDSVGYYCDHSALKSSKSKHFSYCLKRPTTSNAAMKNWCIVAGDGTPGVINDIYKQWLNKKHNVYFFGIIGFGICIIVILIVILRRRQ